MTMTSQECMATRILAQVDRDVLCQEAGVAERILADFEDQRHMPGTLDLEALKTALEKLGIEFLPERGGTGVGVRLRFSKNQSARISTWEAEGGEVAEDSLP